MILSKDWSAKMNGYFATDWSHLWLPYIGHPNQIKVEREHYMKNIVPDLNDLNKLVIFSSYILGNFYFDTFFEELEAELSHTANSDKKFELLHSNQISKLNCPLVNHSNDASVGSSHCTLLNSSFTNHCTQLANHNLWAMYFATYRNTHGVDVGYLLIDSYGIQTYFFCNLEFECTNNDVEYEALIQGVGKVIDVNIKCIEVFCDSR